ncbi:MAG: DUF4092 domain-containing protein, partial [Sulfurovaceae bacterium]|nr:DUF4092 domain-containing protein [Sulfurovaceae bacterium]
SDLDTQLEKIFNGVREFHIFKQNYTRWEDIDTFKTLVTGQNGFPIFSPRSDKDPKFTDYPIDYNNRIISRYRPVRPPKSVKSYYTDNNIALGNKDTATYNAPIVAGGTIGKGRVLVMGSHLYASILVNPRNYSNNVRNEHKTGTPDSPDMENFFHNVFSWLTEQNSDEDNHYTRTGTPIKILSNKTKTVFWGITAITGIDLVDFKIHDNFNFETDNNPKVVSTWKDAKEQGLLNPSKYPLLLVEDFEMTNTWGDFYEHTVRKTALDEVDLIVDYIRAGGGVIMMESPHFMDKYAITETASNEIMKKAGVTTFFENNKQDTKLLPNKTDAGGVAQYDMCVADYISHTDLQRRLEMDDYSNVPTTLQGLKELLDNNGKLSYL